MSIRVLIVDDDADLRAVVHHLLTREGMEVGEASNAEELFAALDEGELPDLILLDLTMPGSSGWNVFPRLKSDPERAKIPVIVLTGHNDPQFKEAAKARGAAGYLTKPFKDWELIDEVQRHVRGMRRIDPWAR